jgi:uncharacterized protein YcnI
VRLLTTIALAASIAASGAHPRPTINPTVALRGELQLFSLIVPSGEFDPITVLVELIPPRGFEFNSFAPAPGWRLRIESSGDPAVVTRLSWAHGPRANDDAAVFQFVARGEESKDYVFRIRLTYSDGSRAVTVRTVQVRSSLVRDRPSILWAIGLALGAVGLVGAVAYLLTVRDRQRR